MIWQRHCCRAAVKGICELLGTGLTAQNDVHFIGYIAGIFAILGHVFPIYYHFKGGKGVLVGVSVFLGIDWKVFLCLIVIFAVVLAISKYVSLARSSRRHAVRW